MKLPIEIISEEPLKFKWDQELNLPSGLEIVPQEGHLPSNVEEAVAALIRLCKSQAQRLKKYEQQYEVGDKPLTIDHKVFPQEVLSETPISSPTKKKGK